MTAMARARSQARKVPSAREGTAMPVMSEYPPGAPCWVDLSTAEPAASLSFYTGLFGWASYAAPGGGDAA